METTRRKAERKVGREELDELMGEVFGGEIHAQRVASRRHGVDAVLHAARLGVRAIGHGLAAAVGLTPRHAITQVDRLLSTPKRLREDVARGGVRCVVAERQELLVNVDWTEREDADPAMSVLGTHTTPGRSPPLVWKTVRRSERQDQRHAHADERLGRLADVLAAGVHVTVLADRGVSDTTLSRCLTEARGVASISRCRGGVDVESADGARRGRAEAQALRRACDGRRRAGAGRGLRAAAADAEAVAAREPPRCPPRR
jgi:hypothetical protein